MKIPKKHNLIFIFSIVFFFSACFFHFFAKEKIANAYVFTGSAGGRILMVFKTPEPPPAGACVGTPCACSATYTTTIMPAGGNGALFCFPLANIPNYGPPVTPASSGYQILGFWATNAPVAASANWGTFP